MYTTVTYLKSEHDVVLHRKSSKMSILVCFTNYYFFNHNSSQLFYILKYLFPEQLIMWCTTLGRVETKKKHSVFLARFELVTFVIRAWCTNYHEQEACRQNLLLLCQYKLVKKSSFPLVKVAIFRKLLNSLQIKVHQEEQTNLPLILIPNL